MPTLRLPLFFILFFLMPPPPPRSPLFPYTTLFRSPMLFVVLVKADDLPRRHVWFPFRCSQCSLCSDRKSTRLNSSHVSISYAVFCLKKKNKKSSIVVSRELVFVGVADTIIDWLRLN